MPDSSRRNRSAPSRNVRHRAPNLGEKSYTRENRPIAASAEGTTHWDRVAAWYDGLVGQKGSDYHRTIVMPGALRLLDVAPGQQVLDIGCGQGVFCRLLAESGARALGIDASAELIEAAQRRSALDPTRRGARTAPPRFQLADATKLDALREPVFDAASCLLAIQNIDPIEPVFAGCARLLRPGGRLVVVMTHPAFRIPRQSGWGWDEARQLQFRRVDHYLSPLRVPIQTHPGADPEIYTWSFHRPIASYVAALAAAGLVLDALEEWPSDRSSQPGARSRAENRSRREIPLFLALRALKPRQPENSAPPGNRPENADCR